MAEPRHDPVLRQVLANLDDTPTVTASCGTTVPASPTAAAKLNARLNTVTKMYVEEALTGAQFVAATRALLEACEATSVLHHMLQPEQIEAARAGALLELTLHDLAELRSLGD